jgi:hypothetical protein
MHGRAYVETLGGDLCGDLALFCLILRSPHKSPRKDLIDLFTKRRLRLPNSILLSLASRRPTRDCQPAPPRMAVALDLAPAWMSPALAACLIKRERNM